MARIPIKLLWQQNHFPGSSGRLTPIALLQMLTILARANLRICEMWKPCWNSIRHPVCRRRLPALTLGQSSVGARLRILYETCGKFALLLLSKVWNSSDSQLLLELTLHSTVIELTRAFVSYHLWGPPKKSWGLEMTMITCFLRNAAAHSHLIDLVLYHIL